MCSARLHGAVRPCSSITGMSSLCKLIVLSLFVTLVQCQDATLNDPASATATGSPSGSNSSAASPATTSTAPLSLSPQRVPYLLNQPSVNGKTQAGRGAYFTGCSDPSSVGYVAGISQINISTVYTQFDHYIGDSVLGNGNPYTAGSLRIVGIGTLGNESYAFNSFTDSTGVTRGLLSAIQATTRFSTFEIFSNYTYLCDRLYPTQNDSQHPNVRPSSCQFGPGTVAFGIDIPLNSSYDAGTLMTQIRLTDSSSPALTISCIEVRVSPYDSHQWFWGFLFWFPLALTIAFSALGFFARLITAETTQRKAFKNRAREGGAPRFLQGRLTPIIVAALSGRELVMNAGLVRYVTPGCWDIIFTLQYFVAIAMCHVQWPDFAYPFLRQAAWSTLLGNITLTQPAELRVDPLATNATLPSGAISDQMNNVTSPLYMNASQSNSLLNLGGTDDDDGIVTFAKMVGLQPQNLFGTCLGVWLIIVAIIVVASVLSWLIDFVTQAQERVSKRKEGISLPAPSISPSISLMNMEKGKSIDSTKGRTSLVMGSPRNSHTLGSSWSSATGLHGKTLHGNLIRALLLFHLPITIVSTYQFASTRNHSSTSIGLAALSFTIFSLLLPIYILTRIALTPLQRLYEHLGTLLALGPAYYLYSPGSQLFCAVSLVHSFILGVVVGAGQRSGTAQASVILVVEILAALASTLWLPWSEGAMMGPLSFMTNVLRIIMAILLLMLSDSVGFGYGARTWLTYVILLLQGLYLLGALLVFVVKLVEAFVRVIWRVSFDEKVSTRTDGLAGAIRKIQRRKNKGQPPTRRRQDPYANLQAQRMKLHQRMSSASTSTTAPMLINPQSIPMSNSRSASYAEYLGGSRVGRPTSAMMEENGPIMAALPAVSTRTPDARPASMAGGFIRVGGGRATEENPYATRPTPPLSPSFVPTPRPRPQSQAGPIGSWGAQRNSGILPDNSYFALAKTPSHELSSTQAAALAASQSLGAHQGQFSNQHRRVIDPSRVGPMASPTTHVQKGKRDGRRMRQADDDWSDEEGTTWDSNAVARGKGAWSGVAKMGAALNNFKRLVAGNRAQPVNTEEDVDDALPPSGSGGFEVVRPIKKAGNGTIPSSQSQTLHASTTPSKQIAPGTATTRQFYDSAQQYSDPSTAPTISALPSTVTSKDKRSSSPPPVAAPAIQPETFTRGPLGMLTADVPDTTSSAGHTEEEATEERFWLPPLDLQLNSQENSLL